MDNEQRCGTCQHWVQDGIYIGQCVYPVPPTPIWMSNPEEACRNIMFDYDGKDCPTWHAK